MKNIMNVQLDGLSKSQVIKAVKEKFRKCDVLIIKFNRKTNILTVAEFDGISVTQWRYKEFIRLIDNEPQFNFENKNIIKMI